MLTALALFVLLLNVWLCYERGPLPVSANWQTNPVVMQPLPDEYVANLDAAVAAVPDGARVSASNWIAPHLTHRRHLYLFPVIKDAEYVVVDLARPSYYTSVDLPRARSVLRALIEDPDYEIVFQRRNVAVFANPG
jgi:hypothetical protein